MLFLNDVESTSLNCELITIEVGKGGLVPADNISKSTAYTLNKMTVNNLVTELKNKLSRTSALTSHAMNFIQY